MEVQRKEFQFRHHSLEDRRSFPISPTSPTFSTGRRRCWCRNKSGIFEHRKFLGAGRRTWNLKMTRPFNWAAGLFPFSLSWRGMMLTRTSHLTRWSNNGYKFNLLQLLICGHRIVSKIRRTTAAQHPKHTIVRSCLWRTTTINCFFKACLQILNNLTRWLALQF